MKHKGKARQAGYRIIQWSLVFLLAILGGGVLAVVVGSLISALAAVLVVLWIVFLGFVLYFFRDPTPVVPQVPDAILSPNHGTIDVIDRIEEDEFMGGPCHRISTFMTIFDVHVQKVPVDGHLAYLKYHPGEFLNALRLEAAAHNENILLGFESRDHPGERIGVRLIAGLVARRIVPWVELSEPVTRGERMSLIQFGSRCEIYLPLSMKLEVRVGQKVVGGETIVARRG
jgi:phosphatidylserine decarboxylase